MTDKIWTIREILNWSIQYLKKVGSDTPRLDAELLLCRALKCRRLDLYLEHDKPLENSEKNQYREFIKRRSLMEPVAYILGERDFYSLTFEVNPHVLIPRPETELLIELILKSFNSDQEFFGLDVGTGSGCLAITIQKNRPMSIIEAWDKSELALEVAKKNASKHGVNIQWGNKDVFASEAWDGLRSKLDFIVSNPPYIAPEEKNELQLSVRNYEPELALFAEENGLRFYKYYALHAQKFLKVGGKIFLEIGHTQGSAIIDLMKASGWVGIELHKDLNGHDRVVSAIYGG